MVPDRHAVAVFTLLFALQAIHFSEISGDSNNVRQKRIVFPETKGSAAPWFAAIVEQQSNTERWFIACGGCILSERIVMTAAHCVEEYDGAVHRNPKEPDTLRVNLGQTEAGKRGSGEQSLGVATVVTHVLFHVSKFKTHDIALIGLRESINMSGIQPAKLAVRQQPEGSLCKFDGWGFTEGGLCSSTVGTATLRTAPIVSCSSGTDLEIKTGLICTVTNFTATSLGDSGGPLNCPDPLTGGTVVSGVSTGMVAGPAALYIYSSDASNSSTCEQHCRTCEYSQHQPKDSQDVENRTIIALVLKTKDADSEVVLFATKTRTLTQKCDT